MHNLPNDRLEPVPIRGHGGNGLVRANATPVSSPVDETVAIDAFDVDQLTVRPVRGLPLASFSVAASWSVSPARLSGIPLA